MSKIEAHMFIYADQRNASLLVGVEASLAGYLLVLVHGNNKI